MSLSPPERVSDLARLPCGLTAQHRVHRCATWRLEVRVVDPRPIWRVSGASWPKSQRLSIRTRFLANVVAMSSFAEDRDGRGDRRQAKLGSHGMKPPVAPPRTQAQDARSARNATAGEQDDLNSRQLALIGHALRHPDVDYTYHAHAASHGVVHESARQDLLDLERRGYLVPGRDAHGGSQSFSPPRTSRSAWRRAERLRQTGARSLHHFRTL